MSENYELLNLLFSVNEWAAQLLEKPGDKFTSDRLAAAIKAVDTHVGAMARGAGR